jgi:pimeloyl-ACP methyl ester carboxylesterase
MRPVLLLVPGMLNDASVWDAVREPLETLATVRISLPVQASIPEMAAAAWATVADLPDGAPVVLAGFSLGGYVAIEMLARPQRALHGAALLSTSPRPETPDGLAVRERTIAAMAQRFDSLIDGIVAFGTHEPDAARSAQLARMMRGIGADTAIRQNRAIAARSDHRAALATLRLPQPLAVLCGAHDRITPPELSRETAALVPGAVLSIVDGAGHMLPVERPDAVAAALRPLLV